MPHVSTCATVGYSHYPLEVAAQHIAARAFRQVEITHLAFYSLHYPLDEVTADSVGRLLAGHGVSATAMNYNPGWLEAGFPHLPRLDDPQQVARMERTLRRVLTDAAQLGVRVVTVPFLRLRPDSLEEERQREIEAGAPIISRLADFAAELGIRLALEAPHIRLLYYDLPHLADLLARVASPHLGLLLDSTHWHAVRYDLDEYMALAGQRLCHVHLRDAAGHATGWMKQQMELTPGRGEVDFRTLGEKLDAIGYRGQVTLESEYRDVPLDYIETEHDFGIAHLKRCGWTFPQGV